MSRITALAREAALLLLVTSCLPQPARMTLTTTPTVTVPATRTATITATRTAIPATSTPGPTTLPIFGGGMSMISTPTPWNKLPRRREGDLLVNS